MILPTIMYGLDAENQSLLFRAFKEISSATDTPFRVQMCTTDIDEGIAAVKEERDITLMILGVPSKEQDKERLSLRLGKLAIQLNRDHYIVYMVKNKDELEQVLPLCARNSGIMTCPLRERAVHQVFTPIFEDYHCLYAHEAQKEGRWIHLKSSGRIYRILLDDLCMVQAVNKTIEFHTFKQVITVYTNMDTVEKMLGDSFLRCHRSYFINREKIQYIDFREMTIHMVDGSQAILSRSFKDDVKRCFEA